MMLTENGGWIVQCSAIRNGRSKPTIIIIVMSLKNAPAILGRDTGTVSLVCSDRYGAICLLLIID